MSMGLMSELDYKEFYVWRFLGFLEVYIFAPIH